MNFSGITIRPWRFAAVIALASVSIAAAVPARADFIAGKSAYDRQDYQEALKIWKEDAAAGDRKAQYWLGQLYYYGRGNIEKDDLAAARYYEMAARQRHLEAMYRLGTMYRYGYGVEQSYQKTIYWFKAASDLGYLKATLRLAQVYEKNTKLPRAEAWQRFWYRRAVLQGSRAAIMKLAESLMTSDTIPRDYRRAYMWLLVAEKRGVRNAKRKRWDMTKRFYDGEIIRARQWADDFLKKGKLPPRLPGEL